MEEKVEHQLLGVVCFEEEGAMKTIAVNLQGDLVMTTNSAPSGTVTAHKFKVNATAVATDNTVYYTSETQVFSIRNGV